MRAADTFKKLLAEYDFHTVLDVGAGEGIHTDALKRAGKDVRAIDYAQNGETWESYVLISPVDCIWCCHTLEHMPSPLWALQKMRVALRLGGVLAVTVPPLKHEIVGGHTSLWNAGLLLYNLVLAGFDCRGAAVRTYDYNVSVIVERKDADLPTLAHDSGDIRALAHFFPIAVDEGFDGRIERLNWL